MGLHSEDDQEDGVCLQISGENIPHSSFNISSCESDWCHSSVPSQYKVRIPDSFLQGNSWEASQRNRRVPRGQMVPAVAAHSLWHAQSAAALLDFFLLVDKLVALVFK